MQKKPSKNKPTKKSIIFALLLAMGFIFAVVSFHIQLLVLNVPVWIFPATLVVVIPFWFLVSVAITDSIDN
ncbi:hypothetical protein S7335_2512 [Synechococcus sp. PCC 7335]|nr:hypothetical protein S7335_2512 [Synechococcus sp. PCC 7335]